MPIDISAPSYYNTEQSLFLMQFHWPFGGGHEEKARREAIQRQVKSSGGAMAAPSAFSGMRVPLLPPLPSAKRMRGSKVKLALAAKSATES